MQVPTTELGGGIGVEEVLSGQEVVTDGTERVQVASGIAGGGVIDCFGRDEEGSSFDADVWIWMSV